MVPALNKSGQPMAEKCGTLLQAHLKHYMEITKIRSQHRYAFRRRVTGEHACQNQTCLNEIRDRWKVQRVQVAFVQLELAVQVPDQGVAGHYIQRTEIKVFVPQIGKKIWIVIEM